MRKILIAFLFIMSWGFTTSTAQKLPPQKETLEVMIKVNKYFMEKYADYRTPSFVRKVTRPSNIWTRGVYYDAMPTTIAADKPISTYITFAPNLKC